MVFVREGDRAPELESCELVRFLSSKGLRQVAERFSKSLRMELVEDLGSLVQEDLADPDLAFLKGWEKRKLLKLATEVIIQCASIRQGSNSVSQASTPARSEPTSDEEAGLQKCATETVCLYNGGSSRDLVEHTATLLREFQDLYTFATSFGDDFTTEFSCPPAGWTMCMVVWSAFITNARFDGDACVRRWQQLCSQEPRQATLRDEMERLLSNGLVKSHPLLREVLAKGNKFKGKTGASAVSVIDCTVRECLAADPDKLEAWGSQVMAGWYEAEEDSSAVLRRAKNFMQDSILSIQVPVGAAADTASYGMLMTMSPLAALLLFTHLELRKQGCLRPPAPPHAAMAAAAGAAGGGRPHWQHGSVLLISSSGRTFSLTPANAPPRAVMLVVVAGLRCLARVAGSTWGVLGRVESGADLCR